MSRSTFPPLDQANSSLGPPTDIDASALQLLYELVESYASRSVLVGQPLLMRKHHLLTSLGSQIYWSQLQPTPLSRLRKAGVLEKSGGGALESRSPSFFDWELTLSATDDHVQPNVQMALQVLNDTMESHVSLP